MRKRNVFRVKSALPRMSWSAANLYNLIARSTNPLLAGQTSFVGSTTLMTMYQQRWRSKRFLRSYHGDHIPEKRFKRWFLPTDLPSFQNPAASGSKVPRPGGMLNGVRRSINEGGGNAAEQEGKMPIASLFVREVERRLDTVVFRSCFARSIYEARGMVVQGKVKLNGTRLTDPNHLLLPSDLVSVEPSSIPMLSTPRASKANTQQKRSDRSSARLEGRHAKERQVDKEGHRGEGETAGEAKADGSSRSAGQKAVASGEEGQTETGTTASQDKPNQPKKVREAKSISKRPATLPPGVLSFKLPAFAAPFLFIPPYLEVSFSTCSAIYLRHPTLLTPSNNSNNGRNTTTTSDIPSPYPANGELFSLAWEHYAKNSPRVRGEVRRTRLEARAGRSGFKTARKKDEWRKHVAVRRGWLRVMGEKGEQRKRRADIPHRVLVRGTRKRNQPGRKIKVKFSET